MTAEQRGAARHVLMAVCAVCVCVFSALVIARAAAMAAEAGAADSDLTLSDPGPVAGLRGRLVRLARPVDRTSDLPRSDRVRAGGDPDYDVARGDEAGVTPPSEEPVTAAVTPEAAVTQTVPPEVIQVSPEVAEKLASEVTSEVSEVTQATSELTPDLTMPVSQRISDVLDGVNSRRKPDMSQELTSAGLAADPPLISAGFVADQLRHVFIAVKTSGQFHRDRLPPILDTWFTTAPNQTWFFSDVDDPELQKRTGGHVINTSCSSSHRRDALCCKMAAEYDTFMASGKKWFCHFDDDNYVSVVRLGELLSGYSSRQDWYLGKNSIRAPLQVIDRDRPGERVSFWFATGGAGFCLSRALALKMAPIAGGGRFMRVGDKIRLPDDVTVGYIVEHVLKVPLSVVDQFHSHLEQMKFIRPDQLSQQISFSYSQYPDEPNVVSLDTFDEKRDPTRFYSLHCLFHPNASFCPR